MASTILLVDDDVDIQNLVRIALEEEGYTTVVADDGAAALAVLEAAPPDLIMLDYLMPGMDGPTFVQEAERRDLRDAIPIVLLTASSQAPSRVQEARADGYLGKPFDLPELLQTVASFLAARRQDSGGSPD
jgi:CheY-like chemotaxis protein